MKSGTTYFLAQATIDQLKPKPFPPIDFSALIDAINENGLLGRLKIDKVFDQTVVLEKKAEEGNTLLRSIDTTLKTISGYLYDIEINTLATKTAVETTNTKLETTNGHLYDIEINTRETKQAVEKLQLELATGLTTLGGDVDAAIAGQTAALGEIMVDQAAAVVAGIVTQTIALMAADVIPGSASLHSIWYQVEKSHAVLEEIRTFTAATEVQCKGTWTEVGLVKTNTATEITRLNTMIEQLKTIAKATGDTWTTCVSVNGQLTTSNNSLRAITTATESTAGSVGPIVPTLETVNDTITTTNVLSGYIKIIVEEILLAIKNMG
jgi:hypothetical protein